MLRRSGAFLFLKMEQAILHYSELDIGIENFFSHSLNNHVHLESQWFSL